MSDRIRFIRTIITAPLKPPIDLLGESRLPMRVGLGDLDVNLHVTNSQYLRIMDVGRTDMLLRNGLAGAGWRVKARPVIGSAAIRYKAELRHRAAFELVSEIVGWDEKWFYCQQAFRVGATDHAVGVVKFLFHGGGRKLAPEDVLTAHRDGYRASPVDAPSVSSWADANGL